MLLLPLRLRCCALEGTLSLNSISPHGPRYIIERARPVRVECVQYGYTPFSVHLSPHRYDLRLTRLAAGVGLHR